MHEADGLVREMAAQRGGVVSREQARGVGMTGHLLRRRLRDGVFVAVGRRALVLGGAPVTFERDAWIGLINQGDAAGLTHDTAVARWGVPGFALRPIHVTRSREGYRADGSGVVVHRSHLWPPHHRMLRNGIPTATPTRALFDIANAGNAHPLKLERAFNNAWSRGLTSGRQLTALAKEWCERGRRGSAFIREYVDRHPIAWDPPESNVEARFCELIVDAGMPEPLRQRDCGDGTSWIGRVDVRDPELPLIGEIDSDLFHGAPLDAASDARRDERLNAAGFVVRRFTEFEVWHQRDVVVDRWRDARREAQRSNRAHQMSSGDTSAPQFGNDVRSVRGPGDQRVTAAPLGRTSGRSL